MIFKKNVGPKSSTMTSLVMVYQQRLIEFVSLMYTLDCVALILRLCVCVL